MVKRSDTDDVLLSRRVYQEDRTWGVGHVPSEHYIPKTRQTEVVPKNISRKKRRDARERTLMCVKEIADHEDRVELYRQRWEQIEGILALAEYDPTKVLCSELYATGYYFELEAPIPLEAQLIAVIPQSVL